jgi:hypothetical protein
VPEAAITGLARKSPRLHLGASSTDRFTLSPRWRHYTSALLRG